MLGHREVARDWVRNRGEPISREMKGSRMYHDGRTIWSYGPHWPIARWVRSSTGAMGVFMNPGHYSPSTSHHHSHVSSALYSDGRGARIFHVHPNCSDSFAKAEKEYLDNIREQLEAAHKPRIRQKTRTWHTLEAERYYQEMCAFNEFYQCGWRCIRDSSATAMLARVTVEEGIDGQTKGDNDAA